MPQHYGGLGGYSGGRALDQDDAFEVAVDACLGDRLRDDDALCRALWSALANVDWVNAAGDTAGYSFRAAGDLVAAVSRKGDYMRWYCSAPYAVVSEDISAALATVGWRVGSVA